MMILQAYSSRNRIKSIEIWWFLLNNNRGESNNGLMYAKSLSKNFKNIFVKIGSNNPISEQLSGLNLVTQFIQKRAICIYVHGRANIIFLIISKFLGSKSVLIVNDYMRYYNSDKKFINKIKSIYHRLIHDLSIRFCNKFIFISQTTFNNSPYFKKNPKKYNKNYEIIHPLPSYTPEKLKKDYLPNNKESIDIILITGHTNNKNYKHTLKVLDRLTKLNKKKNKLVFNFHIFGLNLKKISLDFSKNEAFNFYKINTSTKKLINIHKKCEFYISLSKDEGFGIPLLDSILLGCFPIISNINSYKEILEKNKSLVQKSLVVDLCDSEFQKTNTIYDFINMHFNEARINQKKMIPIYKDSYAKILHETKDQLTNIVQ